VVVLGSADNYPEDWDIGFGTAQPRVVFNGGAPSGRASDIRWTHWGEARAFGTGKAAIYRPEGGYYSEEVTVLLRAEAIRDCNGKRAYTRLYAREPDKPGGPLGAWFLWADDDNLCVADY
jgi:hypothetical protein